MRIALTGLWRNPDFVRLWIAQTVSVFGSLIGGWLGSSIGLRPAPFIATLAESLTPLWLASSPVRRLRVRPTLGAPPSGAR